MVTPFSIRDEMMSTENFRKIRDQYSTFFLPFRDGSGGEIREACLKKVPRRPKIWDECLSEKN